MIGPSSSKLCCTWARMQPSPTQEWKLFRNVNSFTNQKRKKANTSIHGQVSVTFNMLPILTSPCMMDQLPSLHLSTCHYAKHFSWNGQATESLSSQPQNLFHCSLPEIGHVFLERDMHKLIRSKNWYSNLCTQNSAPSALLSECSQIVEKLRITKGL